MDWTYKLHVIGGFAAATEQGIDDFAAMDDPDGDNPALTHNMGTILGAIYNYHNLQS
ncbi:hypothetical protein [Lactococcus sp. LG606]|uniref:hypothetical protein n=1 Tax=Lactococcus sp. LG606 TaxID=2816912 RepID=UPI001F5C78E8|nr:hypothetical protein [Lactococcus sp. LG606]